MEASVEEGVACMWRRGLQLCVADATRESMCIAKGS